jgi:hypothetical protein
MGPLRHLPPGKCAARQAPILRERARTNLRPIVCKPSRWNKGALRKSINSQKASLPYERPYVPWPKNTSLQTTRVRNWGKRSASTARLRLFGYRVGA